VRREEKKREQKKEKRRKNEERRGHPRKDEPTKIASRRLRKSFDSARAAQALRSSGQAGVPFEAQDKPVLLGFAPFEFVAEDIEVGFFGGLDQVEALRGASDADGVVFLEGDAGLAVESEEDGFGGAGEFDFDERGIADDDGAIGEGVRADGRDDERLDSGMNDGAAGGEGVGGGAGGSGDDEAVSAIANDEVVIDRKFEFDHASEGGFVDDGVVENVLRVDDLASAKELDLKHGADGFGGAASESFFESGIEFVDGEAGEKAEAAHVDGEDGEAARSGEASGGEKRAVATEDEEEVGLGSDLFARKGIRGSRESGGGFFVEEDAEMARFEPA